MKDLGHPILGDLVYGKPDKNFKELNGQILHAYYLEFNHPRTNERMIFLSNLPEYFNKVLNKIKNL